MGFKLCIEITGSEDASVQSVRVQNFDRRFSDSHSSVLKDDALVECHSALNDYPMDMLAPGQTVIIKQFRGAQCRVTTFKNGRRFEKVKVIHASDV
jgi:hypothetical protein